MIKLTIKNDTDVEVAAWADIIQDHQNGGLELELIGVSDKYRNQGYGQKMFEKILIWMKENKVKQLSFLNSNNPFWSEMKKKYPKNVWLSNNMEGLIKSF